jgi:HSP20 family protein
VERPLRRLARADARRRPDACGPDVEEKGDGGPRQFEEAAHGYHDRMRSPKDADQLMSEMEELFADLCQARLGHRRTGFHPRVDVFRTDEPAVLNVVVELAGVDPGDVDLAVVDDVLVVSCHRPRGQRESRRYRHIEIDHGAFERRILLGESVDAGAAEASYERGLLTIVLPLARRASGPVRLRVTRGGRP